MFRTQDSDMAGLPGMFGEGLAHWHEVSRVLQSHWYHVTVEEQHGSLSSKRTLMINSEQGLQQRLVKQGAGAKIIDVQVLTPEWMNRRIEWDMEPVVKVSMGEDQYGCEFSVIEVESGSVYHTSHEPDFRSDLLTNLRPIFLSTMIRAS
jgi:hypothetical protein